jgi:hypothetical protein
MGSWYEIATVPYNTPVKVGLLRNGRVRASHCDGAYVIDGFWFATYAGSKKEWPLPFKPTHWQSLSSPSPQPDPEARR